MKRKTVFVIAASVLAGAALLTVGGVLIGRSLARAKRLLEVHVQVGPTVSSEPDLAGLLATELDAAFDALESDSRPKYFYTAVPGRPAPPIDLAGSSADSQQPADVAIRTLAFGEAADTSAVAIDPYVLIFDSRLPAAPTADGSGSLADLAVWLSRLDDTSRTPLVVAGDEPKEFAAFVVYLASENLSSPHYELFAQAIERWVDQGGDEGPQVPEPDINALIEILTPIVRMIDAWTSQGVLAPNWTDWDDAAVRYVLAAGEAAMVFRRRSALADLSFDHSFYLRVHRPPVGEGRRDYRLYGAAVAALPSSGPRSDAAPLVADLLRGGNVQKAIEADTPWSPVLIDGAPLDGAHRDIVRWFTGAAQYIVVDEAAGHPVFERLHMVLR